MGPESLARRLESIGRKPWAVPAGMFVAILITYGPAVPWLGFYWDDWPTAWFAHLQGPGLYWEVFASDRPILPWLYSLTTPWLGVSPLAWQCFALVSRWIAVVSAWWLIRMVWPGRERQAALTALLIGLYPGFKQGPVAIIYSHFFLLFGMSFASLGAMVAAIRHPQRRTLWTLAAVLLGGASIFSIEYTAGLELLRPLLLWLAIDPDRGRVGGKMRAVLASWAPYALLFIAYLAWRVLVLGFPTYQPRVLTGLDTNGGEALGRLINGLLGALYTATVGAWGQAVSLPGPAEAGRRVFLATAVVVLAVGAVAFLVLRIRASASPEPSGPAGGSVWPSQALMLGAAAMVAGGLPVWVTQLPVSVEYPWDRLTLPLMLGACLAMGGALELLRPAPLRAALAVTLLGLSAGVHLQSNLTYVDESDGLRSFLWQLSWRIPGLEKGTAVLTNDIPLHYYSDNSLTAPLNWMYAPDNHSLDMDYMLYYPTVRVGLALSEPKPGLPIVQPYRAARFEGSTSQLVALFYAPPGCVHVLDVVLDDSMPNLPASLSAWVPLSRLELIRTGATEAAVPPLYPDEPSHDWCYFYERADLARQRGDWQAVVDLGDLGFAVDHPNDPSERLVFVEGYAHVGRWDRAEELSDAALEQNPAVNRMVCHTWNRILRETSFGVDGAQAASRIRERAACDDA